MKVSNWDNGLTAEQQAEMDAATNALKKRAELFPILQHQRRFLKRMRKGDIGQFPGRNRMVDKKVLESFLGSQWMNEEEEEETPTKSKRKNHANAKSRRRSRMRQAYKNTKA